MTSAKNVFMKRSVQSLEKIDSDTKWLTDERR